MKKFAYAENNLILKLFLIFFIIPFILVTVSWIIISTTLPSQAAISAYEPSLGTKVYDNEGKLMHEFYKQKRKAGYSLMHTIVMIGLYSASKFGNEPSKSDDLNKLIDRKAITFDKFVKDNKEVWL